MNPLGGVCNRIFVLNAALQIAEKCEAKLTVLWWNRGDCGCDFEDVLSAPDKVGILNKKRSLVGSKKLFKEKKWKHFLFALRCEIKYKMHVFLSKSKRIPSQLAEGLNDDELCSLIQEHLFKKGKVYLERCSLGYGKSVGFFRFSNEVYGKAAQLKYKIGERKYYGLHIRRTDHKWAIQYSPLELFTNVIDSYLRKDTETMFFLATDDKMVSDYFKQQYPNNILDVSDRKYGRNHVIAIQDAVVDLLLLSESEKIYGSAYSTFSVMAAAIGGIELCTLSNEELNKDWKQFLDRYQTLTD